MPKIALIRRFSEVESGAPRCKSFPKLNPDPTQFEKGKTSHGWVWVPWSHLSKMTSLSHSFTSKNFNKIIQK